MPPKPVVARQSAEGQTVGCARATYHTILFCVILICVRVCTHTHTHTNTQQPLEKQHHVASCGAGHCELVGMFWAHSNMLAASATAKHMCMLPGLTRRTKCLNAFKPHTKTLIGCNLCD